MKAQCFWSAVSENVHQVRDPAGHNNKEMQTSKDGVMNECTLLRRSSLLSACSGLRWFKQGQLQKHYREFRHTHIHIYIFHNHLAQHALPSTQMSFPHV